MRLPSSAHTSRPWRIHEFTRDFRLEDVWALPGPGKFVVFSGWLRRDFFHRIARIAEGSA